VSVLEYSVARLGLSKVRWLPLLLTFLAFPFTAAGAIGAGAVIAYRFTVAAVQTGYHDVRDRYPRAG